MVPTDCTSKVIMDDLGIKTAVALDVHFQSFGVCAGEIIAGDSAIPEQVC